MKHCRLVCPPLSFQVKGFFGSLVVTNFSTFILGEQCGVLGGAAIFMGDINRSFGPRSCVSFTQWSIMGAGLD